MIQDESRWFQKFLYIYILPMSMAGLVQVVHRLSRVGILFFLFVLVLIVNVVLTDQVFHLTVASVSVVWINLENILDQFWDFLEKKKNLFCKFLYFSTSMNHKKWVIKFSDKRFKGGRSIFNPVVQFLRKTTKLFL